CWPSEGQPTRGERERSKSLLTPAATRAAGAAGEDAVAALPSGSCFHSNSSRLKVDVCARNSDGGCGRGLSPVEDIFVEEVSDLEFGTVYEAKEMKSPSRKC